MKIRCTLPNASNEISGVKFSEDTAGGMLSEEIDQEIAAQFLEIPGYALADPSITPIPAEPVANSSEGEAPVVTEPEVKPAKPKK